MRLESDKIAEENKPDHPLNSLVEKFNEKLSEALNVKLRGFSAFAEGLREMGASDKIKYVYMSSLVKGNLEIEIQALVARSSEKKINVVMDVLEKMFGKKKVKKVLRARERRENPDGEEMFA